MIFPIIALLPFSFSYIGDDMVNVSILYQSRTSYIRYYTSKVIATFIGSFVIIFIPCLLNLIQVYSTFPTDGRIIDGSSISSSSYSHTMFDLYASVLNYNNDPFESLLITHPFLYDAIYLFMFSLYSGIVGVWGSALSTVFKPKYKILLFLPYIIINLIASRVIAALGYVYLADPILYVLPNTIGFNWLYFFAYITTILCISIMLLARAINKKVTEGK